MHLRRDVSSNSFVELIYDNIKRYRARGFHPYVENRDPAAICEQQVTHAQFQAHENYRTQKADNDKNINTGVEAANVDKCKEMAMVTRGWNHEINKQQRLRQHGSTRCDLLTTPQ